jgi:hypothetical protein
MLANDPAATACKACPVPRKQGPDAIFARIAPVFHKADSIAFPVGLIQSFNGPARELFALKTPGKTLFNGAVLSDAIQAALPFVRIRPQAPRAAVFCSDMGKARHAVDPARREHGVVNFFGHQHTALSPQHMFLSDIVSIYFFSLKIKPFCPVSSIQTL